MYRNVIKVGDIVNAKQGELVFDGYTIRYCKVFEYTSRPRMRYVEMERGCLAYAEDVEVVENVSESLQDR